MHEITEVVFLRLKDGQDPEKHGSAASHNFARASSILSEQSGFVRSYHGVREHNASEFVWIIDWKDMTAYKTFIASTSYQPFMAILPNLFDFTDHPPTIYYFTQNSASAVAAYEASLTELVILNVVFGAHGTNGRLGGDPTEKFEQLYKDNGVKSVTASWSDYPEVSRKQSIQLQVIAGWETIDRCSQAILIGSEQGQDLMQLNKLLGSALVVGVEAKLFVRLRKLEDK